jgi:predicted ATPase
MKKLYVENFGQIKKADITFGDLTLLVGSQVTGKTILLELIKLVLDNSSIVNNLKINGYNWKNDFKGFSELYFGGGMENLWNERAIIELDKKIVDRQKILILNNRKKEQLFYIPAQRILTLENGWPRPFTGYESTDPYVLRDFSEKLRLFMQDSFNNKRKLFPRPKNFNRKIIESIQNSIFHDAEIELNTVELRKRILLDFQGYKIPYMAWSTGQREFMPLLLGLYYLSPEETNSKLSAINWVVVEEPEMGLHPRGILSVILTLLELIDRGYKLLVSTHSPVFLEALRVIQFLKKNADDPQYLNQLFDMSASRKITILFKNILDAKKFKIYYFDRTDDGVITRDISSLDPFSEDAGVADWGGLTSFSSRASEVVSRAAREKE